MRSPIYFNWPGKIWLFSDPHFNDKGILQFERTEFQTVEDHNNHIITSINRTVKSGDTLICLGDLGHNWPDCITKIKDGVKKILIMGNHDSYSKVYYKKYFDEVYDGPLFINKFIVLSHEPIPVTDHFINIHGHLHSSYLDSKNHINISFKMIDYKLADLDAIYTREISKHRPRIHARFLKEWYADLYVFTDLLKDDVFMYKDTGHVIPRDIIESVKARFNVEVQEYMLTRDSKHGNYLSTDTIDDLETKILFQYNTYINNRR